MMGILTSLAVIGHSRCRSQHRDTVICATAATQCLAIQHCLLKIKHTNQHTID